MTACTEWRRCKNAQGYGVVRHRGAARLVHRIAWAREHGPIPAGIAILHKCDNPACYNIEHLFAGTQSDNVRDMDSKGRRRNRPLVGEAHGRSRFTNEQRANMVRMHRAGVQLRTIVATFGGDQSNISRIIRTWRQS